MRSCSLPTGFPGRLVPNITPSKTFDLAHGVDFQHVKKPFRQNDRRVLLPTARPVQHQQRRPRAAALSASAPEAISVRFRLKRRVDYGESHLIVGSHPSLGDWGVTRGIQMTWAQGDEWSAEVQLSPGTNLEFKCVHVGADGTAIWEDGSNREFDLATDSQNGLHNIDLKWGKEMKTTFTSFSGSVSFSSSDNGDGGVGATSANGSEASLSYQQQQQQQSSLQSEESFAGSGSLDVSQRQNLATMSTSIDDNFSLTQRWEGQGPVFMRSNEHSTQRIGVWDASGLSGAPLQLVEGDREAGSWLKKLEVAKRVLVDNSPAMRPDLQALSHSFVYLTWVATGGLQCVEAGGHRRPNHHAELSRLTFRSLEWVVGERPGTLDALLARRMHTRLPSFTESFTQSTPLTRIRDIAHRNDIPQWLKQEIKHTIQNKLHRNAGPEDLVATETLLARIESAPAGEYSESFINELRTFLGELKDFFNAGSLGDLLSSLSHGLDEEVNVRVIERFLSAKAVLDGAGTNADENAVMDALHGATSVRALLASGLSSGLRNDAPDRAMVTRQRWRLAEIRAEDYVFVLLSRFVNILENKGGVSKFVNGTDGTWSLPIGALVIGLRHVGLCGFRTAECMALEHELAAWQRLGAFSHKEEALRLRATLQRLRRLAEVYSQHLLDALSEPASTLGKAFGMDKDRSNVFAESEIRSNVVFQLSKLTSMLLEATAIVADVSPWDVIVAGSATGVLIETTSLAPGCLDAAQGQDAILVVGSATGDEEVGALGNTLKGVILKQQLPHLSHLGVRARQEKVPFVACEDVNMVAATLKPFVGTCVSMVAQPDNVNFSSGSTTTAEATRDTSLGGGGGGGHSEVSSSNGAKKDIPSSSNGNGASAGLFPSSGEAITNAFDTAMKKVDKVTFVPLEDATNDTCGAKAAACGQLLALAAECALAVQSSGSVGDAAIFEASHGVCLPFGCMQAALKDDGKVEEFEDAVRRAETAAAACQGSEAALGEKGSASVSAASLDALCDDIKSVIASIRVSQNVLITLGSVFDPGSTVIVRSSANVEDLAGMSGAGLYDSIPNIDPRDPGALQAAITAVWASLYSRRALLARAAAHVPHGAADMAVIVQRQLAPELSFVLHTVHPQTGDDTILVAEIAPGMGETLASGTQGSGWRLEVDKASGKVKVVAFANFSAAYLPAAARKIAEGGKPTLEGLVELRAVDYSEQELSWSEDARTVLGKRLAAAGRLLENDFGGAQDVEGCVFDGKVFILQTRPQP